MWNFINNESEKYMLNIRESDGYYDFFLSNLKCVWKIKLKESEIVKTIQELNPHIEATPRALLDKTINLLSKSEEIIFVSGYDLIILKIESKIGGFPFRFNLELNLMPQENIYQDITLPLVLMVQELKTREEKLIAIIRQKDNEIEDYRLGGAQISHKFIRTKVFDEKVFQEESSVSEMQQEVLTCPVKIFDSPLNLLYESASKRILENDKLSIKEEIVEDLVNDDPPALSQHSPDLFDSCEPEVKNKEVQKKMPTLLRVELKHKRPKKRKNAVAQRKLML